MARLLITVTGLVLLLGATPAAALDLSFEVFPGAPLILSSTLSISQDGFPDLEIDPDYANEPLKAPWYYALRLSTPVGDGAWAVELLHQKMMLTNPPPEVGLFQITHGYNIFTVQRHWTTHGARLIAGAGWVAAHPENTVRGQALNEATGLGDWGYHLAGPALLGGVGKRHRLGERVFLAGEARLVASWVTVPVVAGEARIADLTAHFLLGVGVDF
jgi:hypothetical protein